MSARESPRSKPEEVSAKKRLTRSKPEEVAAEKRLKADWAALSFAEREARRNAKRIKQESDRLMKAKDGVLLKDLPSARERRLAVSDHERLTLRVADVIEDAQLRHVLKRFVSFYEIDFPRRSFKKAAPKVRVEVRLLSYLTARVPAHLRTKTVYVRSEGEILIVAASMYERIYAEDERLGGETTTTRDRRLKREGKPKAFVLNRDDGPYVWGHDVGDLFFEGLIVRWTGRNACIAWPEIGS